MTNLWEIAGISLQIFAGIFLILNQIAEKLLNKIAERIRNGFNAFAEREVGRGRVLTLIAIISLPTIMLLSFLVEDKDEITWSVIGGLVIWSIVGYDVYLYSLGAFGKRLINGSYRDGLKALVSQGKLRTYNLILFTASLIGLVLYYFALSAYVESSQNLVQQLLMLAFSLLSGLTLLPVFLMSFIYLFGETAILSLSLLVRLKRTYFWIAILIMWLIDGAFLLVYACFK